MPGATRAPHPALAHLVGDYVGYDDRMDPGAVHHGLPSPAVTVILAFDAPLESAWPDGPMTTHWRLAGGLHLRPVLVHTRGHQHGIQLSLTPRGARALLGLPAGALAGEVVDHDELPGGISADTHARLAEAQGWQERFDILDAALLRLAERARQRTDADLDRAWALLERSHGRARIEEVARAVGRSPRWLSGRFAAELGVSPKQAARLHRFDHARRAAQRGIPLGQVAAEAGYADQSHLTRDWGQLARQTPRELVGEPFRFVQD
ncbi:helix-turn-helix domain-containing protein [Actinomycetota bacterium]